jgi:hypothetical protein
VGGSGWLVVDDSGSSGKKKKKKKASLSKKKKKKKKKPRHATPKTPQKPPKTPLFLSKIVTKPAKTRPFAPIRNIDALDLGLWKPCFIVVNFWMLRWFCAFLVRFSRFLDRKFGFGREFGPGILSFWPEKSENWRFGSGLGSVGGRENVAVAVAGWQSGKMIEWWYQYIYIIFIYKVAVAVAAWQWQW